MTRPQLRIETIRTGDVAQLETLMTRLVGTCAAIGRQRTAEGRWQPASPGSEDEFAAARDIIEEISRTLNQTRRGIRKIGPVARVQSAERMSSTRGSQLQR